jgi:hypothetical protein
MSVQEATQTGSWRTINERYYQFVIPGLAVIGYVEKHNDRTEQECQWYWEARTMLNSQFDRVGNPRGYAPDMVSAMRIVQCLCYETNTCKRPEKQTQ